VEWATGYANDLINSAAWATTAVLITWDGFGGFYDHAAPPSQYGCDTAQPYGEGFRVPLILVSPWVKPGVFHGVAEQASVVRLIEELFAPKFVGFLGQNSPDARDGVAGSLLDAFDFAQAPLPAVPASTTCPSP
jgi:phospholipase C